MDYKFKRSILFIFIIFYAIVCQSQEIFVPYRIGDKFGISNEKGKIILKPSFDILEPGYGDVPYFIGYNFKDEKVSSSFIYNNKILIADKPYRSYHIQGNLIVAISYTIIGNPKYSREYKSNYDLYDLKGKKILDGAYENIFIIDKLDHDVTSDEVLIATIDKNERNSLFIYNIKRNKFIKTLFENSQHFDVKYNSEVDLSDKSITITHKNVDGQFEQINIVPEKKALKVTDLGIVPIKKENSQASNVFGSLGYGEDMVPRMQERMETKFVPEKATDSIISELTKVGIKRSYYFSDNKIEEMSTTSIHLKLANRFLIKRNGLVGMFDYDHKTILPIQYDEILGADFNGYILKKDGKYGLFIYRHPESKIIEPIFDMFPLLYETNVLNKGFLLIKLYDSDGKFFCYVNESGMLYYHK